MTIAIYTLRLQGQQELKRDQQTQIWHEKERRQARAWSILDIELETKKSYLTKHKDIVDEYVQTLLMVIDRIMAKRSGLTSENLDNIANPLVERVVNQTSQAAFHVEVFNDLELKSKFGLLLNIWENIR